MNDFRTSVFTILLLAFVSLMAACSEQTEPVSEEASGPPLGQLGFAVVPNHYRIDLTIDPSRERFSGQVSIDVTINESLDAIWLHGKNLNVTAAEFVDAGGDAIAASYEEVDASGVAQVTLAETIEAGEGVLNFTYDAPFNTSTNALFKVERNERSYAATQFQPIGARQVFPGFDEPGFKVPFDLALTARADDVVITTTPEISATEVAGGLVRHEFETTRPLPTYLIAIAVGPYDLVDAGVIAPNDIRDRELPLRAIAAHGLGERLNYALDNTDGLLTSLEEYFGRPYPYRKLDLIAMPESFGGAMENVGAITYDEFLLLMDEDSSLQQRRAYTAVHAHEMAHMWFGNLVTPAWWNDIWLNESFASWMEYKAADAYWPEGEFGRSTLKDALGAMGSDSLASARQIREPIDHNNDIDSAFDSITYEKGAGVLSMLERYVGEERFQAGVQLHMERFSDTTATAEDFIQSLADGSERPEIGVAFTSFIEQPGVPLVSVAINCEDGQAPGLRVSQSRYAPLGSTIDPDASVWQLPLCYSYVVDGERMSDCSLISEQQQTLSLDVDSCPTAVHPNADGAGYYRFTLADQDWAGLLASANELPATEALALADSLDAAFRSGTVSADDYVGGMAMLINHPSWDVAAWAADNLEVIAEIIEAEQLDTVNAAYRRIVGPRYAALADTDDAGDVLLHRSLQRFMIVIAEDPELRAPLAEQASAWIGLDGEPDPSAIDVDELETVLSIGVQDIGEAFFDRLLELVLASEDPAFRGAGLGALARVEDPVLVARLQDTVLSGELKGTDLLRIVFRQMVRVKTQELTYAWFMANDEALVEMIPETFRPNVLPAIGGSFCDIERGREWEALVISHADSIPGYERSLANSMERVQLCSSLRDAQANDLVAAFEGAGH